MTSNIISINRIQFYSVYIDNAAEHHSLSEQAGRAIYSHIGTNYTIGNAAILLYPASGASDDFAAGVANINLAFTIELPGGGSSGFDLPANRIPDVVHESFLGLREYGLYIAATFN